MYTHPLPTGLTFQGWCNHLYQYRQPRPGLQCQLAPPRPRRICNRLRHEQGHNYATSTTLPHSPTHGQMKRTTNTSNSLDPYWMQKPGRNWNTANCANTQPTKRCGTNHMPTNWADYAKALENIHRSPPSNASKAPTHFGQFNTTTSQVTDGRMSPTLESYVKFGRKKLTPTAHASRLEEIASHTQETQGQKRDLSSRSNSSSTTHYPLQMLSLHVSTSQTSISAHR